MPTSYNPEQIAQIQNLCDNLIYNNYLQNGVLNTREEIQSRIRSQVTDSFVSFWGQEHAEQIQSRVDSIGINFIYQTTGAVNSVESLLKQIKINNFQQTYGFTCSDPETISTVSFFLSEGHSIEEVSTTLSPYCYKSALEQLGVSHEQLLNDPALQQNIIAQIKDIDTKWTPFSTYSNNPEINQNILKLENFIRETNMQITQDIVELYDKVDIKNSMSLGDYIYFARHQSFLGTQFDPLAQDYTFEQKRDMLTDDKACEAYYVNDEVTFGVMPSDEVILHEFVHALDKAGFEKGHFEMASTEYSGQYRMYEEFNEVVTDYFAVLMYNERARNRKPVMVNGNGFNSLYSQLFDIMGSFISSYLPELKETRLREYPAEEFMRVIGKEEFENIATLCNELIALSHDRNALEIISLSDTKELELDGILTGVKNNQSKIRQLINIVTSHSQELANKFQGSDMPHLRKFSELLYGATNTIGRITQRHVAKNLDAPLQGLDEMEDEQ